MTGSAVDVLVIGGGPAGLATSRELTRRDVAHRVLERGARPGHTWENLYDSLRLHTGKHLSALPGRRMDRSTPVFVSRDRFVGYLHDYAREFAVPLDAGCEVRSARRVGEGWVLETSVGEMRARALVVATGIVARPRIPEIPGRSSFGGRVMHSSEYRRPEGFAGRRVLVIGVGNSGGEIGSELARAGARVTVAVRSGANVVPLTLLGLPIQYASFLVRKLPRRAQEAVVALVGRLTEARRGPPVLPRPPHSPLDAIPLIGFALVDEIRAGRVEVRGAVRAFTAEGVLFESGDEETFDDVILATGFLPAIGFLGDEVRTDEKGFALREGRVRSADQPDLYFVGHNYDALGGLYNIARDAPLAARLVSESLARVL